MVFVAPTLQILEQKVPDRPVEALALAQGHLSFLPDGGGIELIKPAGKIEVALPVVRLGQLDLPQLLRLDPRS